MIERDLYPYSPMEGFVCANRTNFIIVVVGDVVDYYPNYYCGFCKHCLFVLHFVMCLHIFL